MTHELISDRLREGQRKVRQAEEADQLLTALTALMRAAKVSDNWAGPEPHPVDKAFGDVVSALCSETSDVEVNDLAVWTLLERTDI